MDPEYPQIDAETRIWVVMIPRGCADDDATPDDEDLVQNPARTEIFEIDGPGHGNDIVGLEYIDD